VFALSEARAYILYRYGQGFCWQTINGDYSALLNFYVEVLGQKWDVSHIPRPRKKSSLPPLLSTTEVKSLIEHTGNLKHQAFIALLYGSGLRLSEALNLRISEIDGVRRQIRVIQGKGGKDRYVSIPECLLVVLRAYYRVYLPVDYLFNGRINGSRWSATAIRWFLKKSQQKAGITRRVSPHVLRHCYATHHLENGSNLVYLKSQLGHKNLKTTAQYIRLCQNYQNRVNHPLADMEIAYHLMEEESVPYFGTMEKNT
jgi:site-specific recombinase XerD